MERLTLAEKSARKPFVGDPSTVWNDSSADHARIVAAAYARLSVADGPGPEERPDHIHEWFEDTNDGEWCYGCGATRDRPAALPENREEPSR